jgi:hypothetical protein
LPLKYQGGGRYFGIIEFAIGIGFLACGLKEVVQKAVNCDGLVSHAGVI